MSLEEDSKEFDSNQEVLKQCRCCMKSDKIENMSFIYDRNNTEIVEMFSKYTSIEIVRNDELPELVCTICLQKIIQFLEFCVMCAKSDTAFREQKRLKDMINVKVEEINQESDINMVNPKTESFKTEIMISEIEKDRQDEKHNGQSDDDRDDDGLSDLDEPSFELKNNKVEATAKTTIFPCPQCNKKFYRERRLEGHLRQHQGLKPAVCTICSKEFSKWPALDTHIMYSHNNAERKFICDEPNCEKSYIMKQSLTTHKKRAHSRAPDLKPESCYICELCGKSFATTATLKKHSFIHTGQRPFKCTLCPKKYITNHKLKEHMMRHEGIKNFVCPVCGMKKTTMHELKIHMNYHTREKLYPCKACTAVFSSPGNRGRHFKIVHCGIKAYQCSHCERSFGKAETLKHHVMTHTGEKPHACSVCAKRFIQLVALQTHMKTHNKSR